MDKREVRLEERASDSEYDTPIRVLHVDDDNDLATLAALYLERTNESLHVVTEQSATAGLDRLKQGDIDCIVSDYDMPGMNGLGFLRAVRERNSDIPFVLFTGKGSEEIASDAVSAGVTDYLQKETGTEQYTVLANRLTNAVHHNRAERALRESEARYRTVVEGTHDAIFIYQDGEFRFANGRTSEISGYDRSELYELDVWSLVHPDDRDRLRKLGSRRRRGDPVSSTYDARVIRKDGEVRYCEFSVQPVQYSGEYAALGSVRDVTERRRAEERFQALIEHSTDIFTVLDENGMVRYESPSVEQILGYEPETLIGRFVFEYIHPEDRETAWNTFLSAISEPGFVMDRAELRFRRADGSWCWLEVVGSNRQDTSLGGYVLNSRDINKRKRRESDRDGDPET